MRRLKKYGFYAAVMAAGVMAAPVASAQCGRRLACNTRVVQRARAVVVQKVVKEVVAVAEFVPVFVPTYVASYAATADYVPQAQHDCKALQLQIQRLQLEVQKLRAQVQQPPRIEKVQDNQPAPRADVDPAPVPVATGQAPVALFQAKCAACHEAKVADEKGHGFVLLNGKELAKLTDRQLMKVGSQTVMGYMPKNGELTTQEQIQIQTWIDSVASK